MAIDADEAWRRLADLGAVDRLLSFLSSVELDGDHRRCFHADGSVHEELILDVDPERRRVAYAVVDSSMKMTHHSASMQLEQSQDGLVLVWTTDFLLASLTPTLTALADQGVTSIQQALSR